MSVQKIAGIETEYGILIRSAAYSDPIFASQLLLRYCDEAGKKVRQRADRHRLAKTQDLGADSPISNVSPVLNEDAVLLGAAEGAQQGKGSFEAQAPNASDHSYDELYSLMLPNGARFYIDHAHPEYSTAEAATPRGVVAADKAGEIIVERCRQRANASGLLPAGQEIAIYKNNSDQKGNSYGCHENYLLAASTFEALLERKLHRTLMVLVPFLVTRTLLCGAGKVGAENGAPSVGFQLAQRTDFFETLIGLQTTYHRPLINTRDEAHADASCYRRLHVICGDANMAEYSTYLKVGVTQLVLLMLEDDQISLDFSLEDPIAAAQAVSRDLSFRQPLALAQGGTATALEIQYAYLQAAQRYLATRGDLSQFTEVVQVWEDTLTKIATDWHLLSTQLDWAIKRNLLERFLHIQQCDWETVSRWQAPIDLTFYLQDHAGSEDPATLQQMVRAQYPTQARQLERYMQNEGLSWSAYWRQRNIYFALRRLDLQYHDIRRDTGAEQGGIFYRLQKLGAVERLLRDDEIEHLVDAPPDDTRAFLRGYCLSQYADQVRQADWSKLSFVDTDGRSFVSLSLPDPTAGTKAQLGSLLEQRPDLSTLMSALQRYHQPAGAGERMECYG